MVSFMNNKSFINLMEENTCSKGKSSCIELILTNRRYSFKHTSFTKTGLSDHHHLILSIMKTTFEKEESKEYTGTTNILVLSVLSQNCCLYENNVALTYIENNFFICAK